jgi:hypothetical protein
MWAVYADAFGETPKKAKGELASARQQPASVPSKINALGRNSADFNEESVVLAAFTRVLRA